MSNSNNGSSITWTGLLGLLFIGLKLTGYIAWPWTWVLCPIWAPLAILAAVFVIALIFGAIFGFK